MSLAGFLRLTGFLTGFRFLLTDFFFLAGLTARRLRLRLRPEPSCGGSCPNTRCLKLDFKFCPSITSRPTSQPLSKTVRPIDLAIGLRKGIAVRAIEDRILPKP